MLRILSIILLSLASPPLAGHDANQSANGTLSSAPPMRESDQSGGGGPGVGLDGKRDNPGFRANKTPHHP